jgi:S-adenosylmethionine-diacylgycerolhomoserine-N-methlytransferase
MNLVGSEAHGALMDGVYRRQRHVYDLTRKYYLIGRDRMIAGLEPPVGGRILEIGCGTGRNLVMAARLDASTRLFGIDISTEMLRSAGTTLERHGLVGRVRLAQADATAWDPPRSFGTDGFDRIYYSYTLSMIPDWRAAITRAVAALAPGGSLHVVDFGDQEGLPRAFRAALFAWLGRFHVAPRSRAFSAALVAAAAAIGADYTEERPYRGYAWHAVLRRPGRP